ncbi:hypothetical protein [Streptomyces litchfieldiae]|uniref:Uncharacterized protein n=1 Tax=Streptomyces litchfieldiae TaxID=3075543 RepID=A0ABU2MPV4_9ACTN|nr:hypothetical protein [Streptomyces sp. DSM 44938]MDT0343657.1 hypothetical protein [Streptomyces sp. DSM 44938]
MQPLFTRFGYVVMMPTVFLPCRLTARVARGRPGWGPVRVEVIGFGALFCGPRAMARRTALAGGTPHPFRGLPGAAGGQRSVLRLLAGNGFVNALLLLWMLSMIALSAHGDWFGAA